MHVQLSVPTRALIIYQFPIKNVLHSEAIQLWFSGKHSSRSSRLRSSQEGAFAAMHFDDLSTFDTGKVHLSLIPPLIARVRFICRIYRERGRRSSSLWNKGSPTAAKPRLERGRVDLILSPFLLPNRENISRSRLFRPFFFRSSIALRSAVYTGVSSKGDDVARIRDTGNIQ